MAVVIPPAPVGSLPGSAYWNDWYEKLRNLVNSGTITQLWTSLNFTSSNITDIVSRAHNNLQTFQGGTAGEYYHLTSAQNTTVGTLTSGVYTPTLTDTTNVALSTEYECQYMRVGSVVTVSGKVGIDPTAAGATVMGMSLPIASNFATTQQCAGTAVNQVSGDNSATIEADTTADTAVFKFTAISTTDQIYYFSFTYRVI